ncbi:MAG: O-antigen ligase family protein [Bacillota bacterium]
MLKFLIGDRYNMKKNITLKKAIVYIIIISNFFVVLTYLPFYKEFQLVKTGEKGYQLVRFDNIYQPKVKILLAAAFVLLILYVFYIIKNQNSFKDDIFNYLIFTLFVLTSLSTYFAVDRFIAVNGRPYRWEGYLVLATYLLFAFLAANLADEVRYFKIFFKVIWISAVTASIYGLIQYFGFDFIKRDPLRENWVRAFSTFGNPNFAASFAACVLPPAVLFYLVSENKKQQKAAYFSSGLFFAFLMATGTRGAWLAFLITSAAAFFLLFKFILKRKRKVIKLIVLFLAVIILLSTANSGLLGFRIFSIFGDFSKLSSEDEGEFASIGSNRMFIYQHTLPLLLERPLLGVGPENFAEVFPQQKYREYTGYKNQIVDKAHSEYLHMGVVLGIPALIIYLLMLFYIFYKLFPSNFPVSVNTSHHSGLVNFIKSALFFSILSYTLQAGLNISVVSAAPVFWTIIGFAGAYIKNLEEVKS